MVNLFTCVSQCMNIIIGIFNIRFGLAGSHLSHKVDHMVWGIAAKIMHKMPPNEGKTH